MGKIMETIIPKLFLLILSVYYSIQQQNLCGSPTLAQVPTPDGQHVADPADCSLYLFCQRNSSDPPGLIAVHQVSCPTGLFFNPTTPATGDPFVTGKCLTANPCTTPLSLCPAAPAPEIMIADPTDTECRRHRQCRLPGMPWISCASGLVFNRNSGGCGLPSQSPCTPPTTALCPPASNGLFPGNTCYHYVLCTNGVFSGEFNCGSGTIFDQAAQGCILDSGNACPQVYIPHVENVFDEESENEGLFGKFVRKY